jgi:tight adherence protein D
VGKIISLTSLLALFVLCGCQSQTGSGELDDSQREYILSKVNNYNGLIKLYREKLSRKEDKDTRYQLAEYYYLAEDLTLPASIYSRSSPTIPMNGHYYWQVKT